MRSTTRTIYGAKLQTSMLLDLDFDMVANTTLNEKFGIQSGVAPNAGVLPSLKYFCIGNGGHRLITGADEIPYTSSIPHRASDAALFNHLPFVLREENNDLSSAERATYGLRREEVIDGTNYFAYYAKRLDLTGVDNALYRTTVTDGVVSSAPFVPTSSNLNPEQPEEGSVGVTETEGDLLSTTALIDVNFNENDVEELLAVAEIIYGNSNLAVISEIGLMTGVDRVVTVPGAGNTNFNFNEILVAQIAMHVTAFYSMAFATNGFNFQIQMGATEPLLGE